MTEEIKSPNYMNLKDEKLLEYMAQYDLDPENFKASNGSVNRKMLNKAMGKVKETLISEPGEATTTLDPTKKFMKELSGMMVQITFYSSDENDLPYVQMALNGIALMVPREKETWIPKEFIDGVLVHAVTTKLKMYVTPDGKIKYQPKQVPRVQYTVKDIKHIDVLRKEYDAAKAKK